jgi:hypothetical protein
MGKDDKKPRKLNNNNINITYIFYACIFAALCLFVCVFQIAASKSHPKWGWVRVERYLRGLIKSDCPQVTYSKNIQKLSNKT